MFNIDNYSHWLQQTKPSIFPESGEKFMELHHLRKAAVSIILVEKDPNNFSIIFGQRSNDVPQHKGQIAFPGGGIKKDETPLETAIRETHEETGLEIKVQNDSHWLLLGEYPKKFITVSDYLITPYIFIYKPNGNGFHPKVIKDATYIPDGYEILEVFDVPLTHLLNPSNVRVERREWQGKLFDIHYYSYNDKVIWGVTGMLLYDFLNSLQPYLKINN